MTLDIEGVLAGHQLDPRPGITPGGNPVCLCGWCGLGHAAHVAAVLREQIAAAWDTDMFDLRDRVNSRLPHEYAAKVNFELTMTPNPYRAAQVAPSRVSGEES